MHCDFSTWEAGRERYWRLARPHRRCPTQTDGDSIYMESNKTKNIYIFTILLIISIFNLHWGKPFPTQAKYYLLSVADKSSKKNFECKPQYLTLLLSSKYVFRLIFCAFWGKLDLVQAFLDVFRLWRIVDLPEIWGVFWWFYLEFLINFPWFWTKIVTFG